MLQAGLPVKIEFIETKEKVDGLLGKLSERAGSLPLSFSMR
jgi:hypothetical protein